MAKPYKNIITPTLDIIKQRKKQPFNGSLNPKQAADGIKAALDTARSLVSDAVLLLENKRFARALALSILAIEEEGKVTILRWILVESNDDERKKAWKEFRQHTKKNREWILPWLLADGATRFEDFKLLHDEEFNHGLVPDELKQLSFYSEITPEKIWSTPEEMIPENIANIFVRNAQEQVMAPHTMTTELELEIYEKHVKPALATNDDLIKRRAFVECYKEAEAKSLVPKGSTKKIADIMSIPY